MGRRHISQYVNFQAIRQLSIGRIIGCSEPTSLFLRFNGHFPGEPGLAGVY